MTEKEKESTNPQEIPSEGSNSTEIEISEKGNDNTPDIFKGEIDPLTALVKEIQFPEVNFNCPKCSIEVEPTDDHIYIYRNNKVKIYHWNCAIHKADRVRLVNLI